jgi:hypothetical protein
VTVALFLHNNPSYEFGIIFFFLNFLLPSGENLTQKNYWLGSFNHLLWGYLNLERTVGFQIFKSIPESKNHHTW